MSKKTIISKREEYIIKEKHGYIKSRNSFDINKCLRGGKILDDKQQKLIDNLDNVIKNNILEEDIQVYRYDNVVFVDSMYPKITDLTSKIGCVIENKSFISTSCVVGSSIMAQDKSRDIHLKINVPKGTNCYTTDNGKESEIILPRNIKMKLIGLETENNRKVLIYEICN